jgi:large subunit ribosomal protein L30
VADMSKTLIKIEQIGSPIRRHHSQRETLIGLGLNRIGRVAQVPDTPETRGMIAEVKHLVRVAHESARVEYMREPATPRTCRGCGHRPEEFIHRRAGMATEPFWVDRWPRQQSAQVGSIVNLVNA